ncbi:CsbA family protein [Bacillus massiliglaciei]|uniref:CsbA family protein n=1 Tax=Bacillus massiliglaciei TaxID=1816693 RepID=UPI000DA6362A|nr:CsbA family protein [Bacillus massiliglaciei]
MNALIKFLSALFLPGLLVMFFTRVTYHHVVGLVLTVGLITASSYKGYTHTLWLIIVDALSLTVGFWLASRMIKKKSQSA